MMKNSESVLIRSIDFLGVNNETKQIAEKLMAQSDMPLVFWMDSELPRNMRARHPEQKNQFWITVQPQADEQERRRLILSGIYGAIQEKKRYWHVEVVSEYRDKLRMENDRAHIIALHELMGRLGSLATSLDIEWFLAHYGISTKPEVYQFGFRKYKEMLRNYSRRFKSRKGLASVKWYREREVHHLITLGNFYRRGREYRRDLKPLLEKIDKQYINDVEWVAKAIVNLRTEYNGTNGNQLTERFMRQIIARFHLEDKIFLQISEAYKGSYPLNNGKMVSIFSYIPEDWPNQVQLTQWIRLARNFICIYRESKMYKVPDITVNLLDTDSCNSFADGTAENGYSISFTAGIINTVNEALKKWNVLAEIGSMISGFGREETYKQLLRMIIYFITAHEYAHILLGDCDQSAQYKADMLTETEEMRTMMERNADSKAIQMIKVVIKLEHRFPPSPPGEYEKLQQAMREDGLEAVKRVLSKERQEEIFYEVSIHRMKCIRDLLMLEEAERFVNKMKAGFASEE